MPELARSRQLTFTSFTAPLITPTTDLGLSQYCEGESVTQPLAYCCRVNVTPSLELVRTEAGELSQGC